MAYEKWTFHRTPALEEFIQAQDEVARDQIELDIQKLETRGIEGANPPLAKKLEGDVYYLRSKTGRAWYRCFYHRNGRISFCGFFGYKKKSKRIPKRVKKTVMDRFNRYHAGGRCQ